MNVFLIGYRATGKTTVAKLLAEQMGCGWMDADQEIERRAGKSICEIFADGGEAAFRDLESRVVAELAKRSDMVVALGGGAVVREWNRAAIAGHGLVVWLQATPETIVRRLKDDVENAARRPALTEADPEQEIRELLKRRSPIYAECADLTVDTEGKSPREIADRIFQHWQSSASGRR